jgi:excisionase family DNA binding protein
VFSDELLTVEELAGYLKLKPRTLYLKLRRGDLPAYKVFKGWRVKRSDIDKWLSENIRVKKENKINEIQHAAQSQF